MNFSAKSEIFKSLRKGMADEIARCKNITGAKTKKTSPINKKLWGDLFPNLCADLAATAAKEKYTSQLLLDCQLRLFYCALVVNLESRNQIVAYDYMDFSRRIGEVWEDFCKVCWESAILMSLWPPTLMPRSNAM
jgi:hypothetical protein